MPSELTGTKTCGVPNSVTNLAPGDICTTSSECYGEGFCESGICNAASTIKNAPCKDTLECQANQYCNENKCTPVIDDFERCDINNPGCKYGSVCTTYQTGLNFYGKPVMSVLEFCIPLFSQKVEYPRGDYTTQIGEPNGLLCESGHFITDSNKYYCMNAPYKLTSITEGFEEGTECFFWAYLDKSDPHFKSKQKELAKCGFNNNNLAYCDIHAGDSPYKEYISAYKNVLSKNLSCNPKSTKCASLYSHANAAFPALERHALYKIQPNGNANVADNDECVRDEITVDYWGADHALLITLCTGLLSLLFF